MSIEQPRNENNRDKKDELNKRINQVKVDIQCVLESLKNVKKDNTKIKLNERLEYLENQIVKLQDELKALKSVNIKSNDRANLYYDANAKIVDDSKELKTGRSINIAT